MKMKTKMKSKMNEKWMEKANCERPYYEHKGRHTCMLNWTPLNPYATLRILLLYNGRSGRLIPIK
jgi:hypothetical protein